ncbi:MULTISPECIES: bifunctional hydroxymethylpyrimidine kinase/phosphomethylpyrimidine kinase [Thermodesulfovibrio]|jgi:hydroxymethylpyrimidine/phosphomethylpyrimidine kinase|uniref:bifunctional hydroxymethylpyrimidine kinase/phosphomethylpyrimidine kinase n=1 Tax=Thermodesulfovibrio TaxID=28261 RepID=UPI0026042BC5|nr:bifunctional hydroxymethylpyrimidine kinase/phosphomethylpyrimidine kinase [Thermodesulfovibrio sp.]
MKVALTIGGSDPTGGAGVQMDIKVFQALGVYGVSVVTAITAQNTTAVENIHPLSPQLIDSQFKALLNDINPYGAKIGMIYTSEALDCIIENCKKYGIKRLIIDPIIKSSTGTELIRKDTLKKLKEEAIPMAEVITANIPEAEILSGIQINSKESIIEAAKTIHKMGVQTVIIKGGHLEDKASDFLYDGKEIHIEEDEKFSGIYHGTGCAFSSAFLSFLCLGYSSKDALKASKNFVKNAIRNAMKLGKGMYLLKI